jgi:YVTN family beta-propeller protein
MDVAILPDSSKAFVACSGGHQVMAIGLAQPATATLPALPDRLLAMLDVGKSPVNLAMKPDGGEIFVSNQGSDAISEIATGANEVGGTYTIGQSPERGLVSADNSTLYVSNSTADNVAIYSIDDGHLLDSVSTGRGPGPMALTAAGHLLLVADSGSGDVTLLRTKMRSLFTLLPAGSKPADIVVKAFELKK